LKKTIRIDTARLARFKFDPVRKLRSSIESQPELRDKLREDFEGTLREHNVTVDDAFRQQLHLQWRDQIQTDIKETMANLPESKKRYYSRIVRGEPLRLRVKVDRATGRHKKRLREEE
jgi:hypothetical protein